MGLTVAELAAALKQIHQPPRKPDRA